MQIPPSVCRLPGTQWGRRASHLVLLRARGPAGGEQGCLARPGVLGGRASLCLQYRGGGSAGIPSRCGAHGSILPCVPGFSPKTFPTLSDAGCEASCLGHPMFYSILGVLQHLYYHQ